MSLPIRWTAAQAASRIAAGEITSSALMEACLQRIAEREPEVGAFQAIDPDTALAAAAEADRAPRGGILHGVPFAAKDIIDTVDYPTGWGSPAYEGIRPARDASCIQMLKDAGALLVGKTVTTEFACFHPGKTANPHRLDRSPGGSSSGSAAAVADGMVPLALGSQTAGSLIRPGAYCGVVAYKPTHGSFDLSGVMGLAPSLDTLGGLARSVDDLMLMRRVLTPNAAPRQARGDGWRPRVALMRGPNWSDGTMEMRDTCQRAMARLADAGAVVGELSTSPGSEELVMHQKTIMAYETARSRIFEYRAKRAQISDGFAGLVETGIATGHAEYREALIAAERARFVHDQQFLEFDTILVPAAHGEAPQGLHATGDPLFSRAWTLLHAPCVSIPFGMGPMGLPMAVQLVGKRNDDAAFLESARWVQSVLDPEEAAI